MASQPATARLQCLCLALLGAALSAEAFVSPLSLTRLAPCGASPLPGGARRAGSATSIAMALESGAKVAVLGVFDRVGMVTTWDVANSPYKLVVQVPIGFQAGGGRLRWNIDGLTPGFPRPAELCEETLPGYIKGCILASEKPPAPQDVKLIIDALPDLKKAVMLSSVGVERRDNFLIKFNPFLGIEKWYAAEEAFKGACAAKNVEYTIVRAGALAGGPFYNTNPEFQSALEDNLFDIQNQAFKLSRTDDIDGKTSRDLASTCLVEALQRNEPVLSVVSEKSGKNPCSVTNRMQIVMDAQSKKERTVYTPSKQDWDAAFKRL